MKEEEEKTRRREWEKEEMKEEGGGEMEINLIKVKTGVRWISRRKKGEKGRYEGGRRR